MQAFSASHIQLRRGFTLVEMAIVIAVISLILGGIMGGQELYRSSQIQSIAKDILGFKAGFDTFRLKYGYPPGDIPDATRYWGTYPGDCNNPTVCSDIANCSSQLTCNGDGNTHIGEVGAPTFRQEPMRVWQHLTNAGMIPGIYSGVPGATGYAYSTYGDHRVGLNCPQSKVKLLGYSVYYLGDWVSGGHPWLFAGTYGNVIVIGGEEPGYETANVGKGLTPAEAWSIDKKIDDGKPGTGRLGPRAYNSGSWAAPCTMGTSTQEITAEYNTTYSGKGGCFLYYKRVVE